ncbi:hypothetical protein B0O99DRAFT_687854 [Bisporella sp. PMI_857]|nr:hypothetical protein B0O99DRAFT_687854 [Bisporella sp. PMI_857]
MSSVFGMNASDFDDPHGDGNKMSLRDQFRLLFPISFAVIAVSVSLAFSPWIRCIIYYSITTSWATLLEYTGIRKFLLNCVKKHEYHEKYGSRYKDRNPDDIYGSQQKKVARIYSRRDRNALNEALDKAKSLDRRSDASSCPDLSDVNTSRGSQHGSRGRLASLLFSIKRPTITQGNGFGDDGDLDAMEKAEWNCLPSSKKAT